MGRNLGKGRHGSSATALQDCMQQVRGDDDESRLGEDGGLLDGLGELGGGAVDLLGGVDQTESDGGLSVTNLVGNDAATDKDGPLDPALGPPAHQA